MIALEHDILLQNGVLYLVLLNQDILSDGLHGIKFLVCLELGQEHLSEGASSDDHQEVEVFKRHRWLVIFVPHELCISQLIDLLDSAPSFVLLDVLIQVLEILSQIVKLNERLVQ